MAGEARLEGSVGKKALSMLKEVTNVLEKHGVEYMLDCGTLLGIVRENRLLPWDNDVDLCVDSSQISKLEKCMFPLWLRGYRVRMAKTYEKTDQMGYKEPRVLKVRNRKRLVHRGDNLLDIFIKYKGDDGFHYLMVGGSFENYILQRMPSEYLENLTTVEFDGKSYPIPEDYDGYLTYRYGDWKTPVKEWDYFSQDQSKVDRPS